MGCIDALARLIVGVLLLILASGLAACQSGPFPGNQLLRLTPPADPLTLTNRLPLLTIKVE